MGFGFNFVSHDHKIIIIGLFDEVTRLYVQTNICTLNIGSDIFNNRNVGWRELEINAIVTQHED